MKDEPNRLIEVQRFLELNFDKRPEYKDIVELASLLCQKPVSLITILDHEINWVKVAIGFDKKNFPKETSFCHYTIEIDDILIVTDAQQDERFKENPLVTGNMGVRFYAGAPLILSNGLRIGTLCLFDNKPGHLTDIQKRILKVLSKQVMLLMELELHQKKLNDHITEIELKNDALRTIAQMQSHDIRQPLTSIMGLVNILQEGFHPANEEWIEMMVEATNMLDNRIRAIVKETRREKDLKLLKYNRMVEEIEDYAILLLDKEGNIENWNKGAEKIKGYNAKEIVGQHFSVFYTEEERKENRPQQLLNRASLIDVARDEGWRVRKDGSLFLARVVITAIHDNNDAVIGFTKVTRDITNLR